MQAVEPSLAAIGFTVKSGWACAVLLTGPATSPCAVDSCRLDISDPAVPESRQPYHEGFATARGSGPKLTRLLTSVERFGRQSVTDLIRRHRASGYRLQGSGIVVGSLIEPSQIANEHIRIHALEGQLFRGVVRDAAVRSKLQVSVWRERDLYSLAVNALGRSEGELRSTLTTLGRTVSGPWRAEQKAAALAAWLVLAGTLPAKARRQRGVRSARHLLRLRSL